MIPTRLEYKWLVGIVFVLALFLDLLDITIVNVAIPTLASEFNTGPTTIEWVVTAYLLSLAIFIPFSGWLGDRFGTKRIFILALAIFLVGSVLSGLAWNIESLIAFRALQGVGGGMITPVGTTMLFRAFPPSERAAASAVLAIPITVAPALGPLVGGYLVDYHDWRWIFFINLPVGIVALVAAIALLREEVQEQAGRLDLPGFVLSAAGFVAVVYALAEAGRHGFDDPKVIAFGLGGVILLALFTWVELRTAQPMLDVRLLGDKLFRASNVVFFAGNAAVMGTIFVLPLFLQAQKGLDPFDVGLVMFPSALGVALMAQPAARLYPKVGPRRLLMAGFAGSMLTILALSTIDYSTSEWLIAANLFAWGLSFGLIIIPIQAATFATITPEATGRASSIFNVGRQVAASFGVAILASVLTSRLSTHDAVLGDPRTAEPALSAFQETFIFGAVLMALGVVAALWIDDRKAALAGAGGFAGSEQSPPVAEPELVPARDD